MEGGLRTYIINYISRTYGSSLSRSKTDKQKQKHTRRILIGFSTVKKRFQRHQCWRGHVKLVRTTRFRCGCELQQSGKEKPVKPSRHCLRYTRGGCLNLRLTSRPTDSPKRSWNLRKTRTHQPSVLYDLIIVNLRRRLYWLPSTTYLRGRGNEESTLLRRHT